MLFPRRNPVVSLSLKTDTLQTHFFPDIELPSDTGSLRNDTEVRNSSKFHIIYRILEKEIFKLPSRISCFSNRIRTEQVFQTFHYTEGLKSPEKVIVSKGYICLIIHFIVVAAAALYMCFTLLYKTVSWGSCLKSSRNEMPFITIARLTFSNTGT